MKSGICAGSLLIGFFFGSAFGILVDSLAFQPAAPIALAVDNSLAIGLAEIVNEEHGRRVEAETAAVKFRAEAFEIIEKLLAEIQKLNDQVGTKRVPTKSA